MFWPGRLRFCNSRFHFLFCFSAVDAVGHMAIVRAILVTESFQFFAGQAKNFRQRCMLVYTLHEVRMQRPRRFLCFYCDLHRIYTPKYTPHTARVTAIFVHTWAWARVAAGAHGANVYTKNMTQEQAKQDVKPIHRC